MSPNVFFRVVLPLLEMEGSALVCISSVLGATNFYSRLLELRDRYQRPLFAVLRVDLSCERCDSVARYTGKKRAPACRHVANRLPPWKDNSKHQLVRQIYENAGRGGDYDRESRGLITDDGKGAFPAEYLERLSDALRSVNRIRPPPERAPLFIVVACDPNGGGLSSDTGIVSAYFEDGRMYLCGLESYPTTRKEREELVLAHVTKLRSVPFFAAATIVWVPENNMDAASFGMSRAISQVDNVYFFVDKNGDEGLRTVSGSKARYTDAAYDYITGSNHLFCDPQAISADPCGTKGFDGLTGPLAEQLRGWKRYVFTGSGRTQSYVTFSGKWDDRGKPVGDKKDDLALCFTLAAYMGTWIARDRPRFPPGFYRPPAFS